MTISTRKSIVATLKALTRQPQAPKADVSNDRIATMSAWTVQMIHSSLSKPVTESENEDN